MSLSYIQQTTFQQVWVCSSILEANILLDPKGWYVKPLQVNFYNSTTMQDACGHTANEFFITVTNLYKSKSRFISNGFWVSRIPYLLHSSFFWDLLDFLLIFAMIFMTCSLFLGCPTISGAVDLSALRKYYINSDWLDAVILTEHNLQNFLAELPWWLHNSAAMGLSAIIKSTGATTKTISFNMASYIVTPLFSADKFSTIGSASSRVSTVFEQQMKWVLLCLALSCCGRPMVIII